MSNANPGLRHSNFFELPLTVQQEDIDALDHVNNLVYLRWTLKAAHAHSASVGWSAEKYRERKAGFVVREHAIKYRRPATLGDAVVVKTWIAEMERVSSIRRYEIRRANDHALLVTAQTTWVFVDYQTMELQRIPNAVIQAFHAARDTEQSE